MNIDELTAIIGGPETEWVVAFDPSADYARALIDQVLRADHADRHWLDVLHFRVFNSGHDFVAYAEQFKATDPERRKVVTRYLDRLIADPANAKFQTQVRELLGTSSSSRSIA